MNRLIYLYVKESPLGLKYLGITIKNPYKYKGSGVYWKLHLKSHNFKLPDIKTEILFTSPNREEIKEKGIYYSKLWNIVESEEWANLAIEDGYGGNLGHKMSEEQKKFIGNMNRGRVVTEEMRKRVSETLKKKYKETPHHSKGKKQPAELVAKRVAKNTGRKHTEETKKVMSEKAMGNTKWVGRHHTEESKKRISESNKGKNRIKIETL